MNRHVDRWTALDDLPELLRTDETGRFLGCATRTVYELVSRGQLRAVRLGRLIRVTRESLIALVRQEGAA
jgi:excisionase family DNA binding protein